MYARGLLDNVSSQIMAGLGSIPFARRKTLSTNSTGGIGRSYLELFGAVVSPGFKSPRRDVKAVEVAVLSDAPFRVFSSTRLASLEYVSNDESP